MQMVVCALLVVDMSAVKRTRVGLRQDDVDLRLQLVAWGAHSGSILLYPIDSARCWWPRRPGEYDAATNVAGAIMLLMDRREPTPLAFLQAFGGGLLTLMSGRLSVLAAIVAPFIPDTWAQGWARWSLFALAIVSAGTCLYQLWKRERENVIALASRLDPQLEIVFDSQCTACIYEPEGRPGSRLLRVGVRNLGGTTVADVVVQLERLEPNPTRLPLPAALLRMHDRASAEVNAIPAHPGTDHTHFDLVAQGANGGVLTFGLVPADLGRIVPPGGVHEVRVVARGRDVPAAHAVFALESFDRPPRPPVLRRLAAGEGVVRQEPVRDFAGQVRDLRDAQRRDDPWRVER